MAHVASLGWTVVARNVMVGRDEIDIVALDPGPPPVVVCVEVRSGASSRFGAPEESVIGRKVRRLYRSMAAVRATGALPDGTRVPWATAWRIDLIAIDDAPLLAPGAGGPTVRHLRGLEPG